jgi:hypothetical protein
VNGVTEPGQRAGTAAGSVGLGLGAIMIVVGGYGVLATASWMVAAGPGENRVIGGVLGIVFCLLAVGIGRSMTRAGWRLLHGRREAARRLGQLFGILLPLAGIGSVRGLFDSSLPAGEWAARMAVFVGVFAVTLTGFLLCQRALPTPPPRPTDAGKPTPPG